MNNQTFLFIESLEDKTASWIELFGTGYIKQFAINQPISQFPAECKPNDICVIAPCQDILLTTVTLPKMSKSKLLQALPFALEEQLITDVTELHFVAGDLQEDGSIPVAVVSHLKMNEWLNFLKEVEIFPSKLLSGLLTLPLLQDKWSGSQHNDICAIRTGICSGFTCDATNLLTLLPFALKDTKHKPIGIEFYSTSKNTLPEMNLSGCRLNITNLPSKEFFQKTAQWIASNPSLNLLQNNYYPRAKSSDTKRWWKLATYVGGAAVALMLLTNLISFGILNYKDKAIENSLAAIYSSHFPKVKNSTEAKQKMAAKLRSLNLNDNKNNVLSLLSQVGQELKKHPIIHLERIDYKDNSLILEMTAARFSDLDNFKSALTHKKLIVKQQTSKLASSVNSEDDDAPAKSALSNNSESIIKSIFAIKRG